MKFPFTRPLIPPVSEWTPHLEPAYAQRYFTNFGPVEQAFTQALTDAFGRPDETCVLCCNATAGLTASLLALGVRGPVITPSFTFSATANAIFAAGCEPVLCDVEPETWECSAETIERAAAGRRPAAILPVRTFGLVRDFTDIAALAADWEVPLVIDAAAALGVDRKSQPALPGETVEVFSLHATKPFGIGEGGAIFAGKAVSGRVRSALNFGLREDRTFGYGLNGKMTEVQAAIGLSVLERVSDMIAARRAHVEAYEARARSYQFLSGAPDLRQSPCGSFPVLLPPEAETERFVEAAYSRGALFRRYYFPALAEGFRELAEKPDAPVSADLSARMVCLPVYADATPAEQQELLEIFSAAAEAI